MSKVKLVICFMKVYFSVALNVGGEKANVLGGNHGLGKVRTEHIKRLAKELIRRFPNKFSKDFKSNKQAVSMLIQGATPKVRNKVAGYITHVFAGMQIASQNESAEEIE